MEATLCVFHRIDGTPYWHALIGYRGQPYLASMESIVWRKYKSASHALEAGKRTIRKLLHPNIRIVIPQRAPAASKESK